ncbi:MAG: hypothetical protein JO019_02110 [Candidatus Kaiserbacteria bacterium]|nr:hypothetical protein [Candidatus Kaiserbacteria bacterium]
MNMSRWSIITLRCGIAFTFLYPPIDAFFNPFSWIGYFPTFLRGFVPDLVLLHSFGAVEIVIAIWILIGWRIFWPAVLATLMLLSIVVFDFRDFEVLFRDLALAAAALSLALAEYPRQKQLQ